MIRISKHCVTVFSFLLVFLSFSYAQEAKSLEGRWNLTITEDGKEVPSWLDLTLVGRFCYRFGSARPVAEIKVNDRKFSFAIPPQWEPKGILRLKQVSCHKSQKKNQAAYFI